MIILKQGALFTGTFSKIYDAIDFFKGKFLTDPHTMFLTEDFCKSAGIKTKLDSAIPVICVGLPTYLSIKNYCYLEYKSMGGTRLSIKFA